MERKEQAGKTRKGVAHTLAGMAAACVCVLLGGCISSYTPHTDKPVVEAADSSSHCPYHFAYDNVRTWFRGGVFGRYDWGEPLDYGYYSAQHALRGLGEGCDVPDEARIDARVEAYVLEDSSGTGDLVIGTLRLATLPYTLGFVPLPSTDHFAVCLQITADDGLVRKGLGTGKLTSLTNVWGHEDTRFNQGETDRRNAREQLLQALLIQAWQEAWASPREEPPVTTCLEDMDAIRKR